MVAEKMFTFTTRLAGIMAVKKAEEDAVISCVMF